MQRPFFPQRYHQPSRWWPRTKNKNKNKIKTLLNIWPYIFTVQTNLCANVSPLENM